MTDDQARITVVLRDPETHAAQILPLDGPYTPAMLATAVGVMEELARRLNHATQWFNTSASLPEPANVDQLVAGVETLVSRLPQLLAQLTRRLDDFAGDEELRSDGMGAPGKLAPPVAAATAGRFLGQAGQHLDAATAALGSAHNCTARLYLRTPVGNQ